MSSTINSTFTEPFDTEYMFYTRSDVRCYRKALQEPVIGRCDLFIRS